MTHQRVSDEAASDVAGGDEAVDVGPSRLPEAAERRLRSPAFSSGLSVNEFAACLQMGLRPVGLVQGFCVMRWRWWAPAAVGTRTTYGLQRSVSRTRSLSTYDCPHYWRQRNEAGHRSWGSNEELITMESAYGSGFGAARHRMMDEAAELGAHGVLGVVDASHHLISDDLLEFHLTGTAVVIDGHEPSQRPWSTFLAGQRLAKLLEAGQAPVEVVSTLGVVAIVPVCVTEHRETGHYDNTGVVSQEGEIAQLSNAVMEAQRAARDRARKKLGTDTLHGADLRTAYSYLGGYSTRMAYLRGTRVREFRDAEPLPAPIPTVRVT